MNEELKRIKACMINKDHAGVRKIMNGLNRIGMDDYTINMLLKELWTEL